MTTITKVAGAIAAGTAIVIKAADGIKTVAVAIHTAALALTVKAHTAAVAKVDTLVNRTIDEEKAVIAANHRRLIAANQKVEDAIKASADADNALAEAQAELARYAA